MTPSALVQLPERHDLLACPPFMTQVVAHTLCQLQLEACKTQLSAHTC